MFFLFHVPLQPPPPNITTGSGPFGPAFVFPMHEGLFQYVYDAPFSTLGLGVVGSIASDKTWRMGFLMPDGGIPTGLVARLHLWYRANATSGTAQVNPRTVMCSTDSDPSTLSLNSAGLWSISWGASDAGKLRKTTIPIEVSLPGAMLLVDLDFKALDWSLATISQWIPAVEFITPP